MEFDSIIQTRHSTRNFDTKKQPNIDDILECINASRFAPMAGNNFSLQFIIIFEKEKIKKLSELAEQDFISQAPFIVAVCSNPTKTQKLFEELSPSFLSQQAGAGIENFLLKIQEKGLASCWIGYFNSKKVKKLLSIPEEIILEAFFPIGFEKITKTTKTRKEKIELKEIIFFNTHGNKKIKEPLIDV